MAQRYIPEDEFDAWFAEWKKIQLSNSVDKEEIMEQHGGTIEYDLEIVGATAIEDKLQEGVPNTIA